jgi:hypothetical protein
VRSKLRSLFTSISQLNIPCAWIHKPFIANAAGFHYLPVKVHNIGAPCTLVEVVDILGDNRDAKDIL